MNTSSGAGHTAIRKGRLKWEKGCNKTTNGRRNLLLKGLTGRVGFVTYL
jgi:hypothetical protein